MIGDVRLDFISWSPCVLRMVLPKPTANRSMVPINKRTNQHKPTTHHRVCGVAVLERDFVTGGKG